MSISCYSSHRHNVNQRQLLTTTWSPQFAMAPMIPLTPPSSSPTDRHFRFDRKMETLTKSLGQPHYYEKQRDTSNSPVSLCLYDWFGQTLSQLYFENRSLQIHNLTLIGLNARLNRLLNIHNFFFCFSSTLEPNANCFNNLIIKNLKLLLIHFYSSPFVFYSSSIFYSNEFEDNKKDYSNFIDFFSYTKFSVLE